MNHYTKGAFTIVCKPAVCIHSSKCFQDLSAVFDPREGPWIWPEGAITEGIVSLVVKCLSGALSYYYNAVIAVSRHWQFSVSGKRCCRGSGIKFKGKDLCAKMENKGACGI
ncbi:(4Fe-4S)-binding protein [Chitinophaga costaii]|uniref:(4Fe-4S)-binding protein n=1 Tax=Chitinophaga costaii TaxID=1335309 RepID=UPI0021CD3E06|nr:(4Fe-4S)-binding protein [Chitinophaga costaii]